MSNNYEIYFDEDEMNNSLDDMIDNLEDFENVNFEKVANEPTIPTRPLTLAERKANFKKVSNYEVLDSFHPDNILKPYDIGFISDCFIEARIQLKEIFPAKTIDTVSVILTFCLNVKI